MSAWLRWFWLRSPWIAAVLKPLSARLLGQSVGAVLGAGEDQERALLVAAASSAAAELALLLDFVDVQVDLFGRLGGGADFDADGVAHVALDQVLDGRFRWSPRRTCVWRSAGVAARMRLIAGQEAHVEHAVGFVEDEDLDAAQFHQLAAQEIAEAAGGGDQDLRALADGVSIGCFR